ncbi:response regulator [Rhodoferax sp. AJA081-3]|uniref:ATP-binding protein n=1 Tax=Rhodoferax sp. AJA081-3 TaxID=2752316 RepID=UPI001ADFEBD9|nr:ATP-binding protein [Rhodoferax sp. AJA081-3]QTN28681.1 response regulator [Rhodoferax sp. AJA081-3]
MALTIGIALGYFLLGKLGLASALPPGFVSAIWPAAGFAFAVVVVWGFQATWLGILLGSVVTNATVGGGFNLNTVALCIAAGTTLQAVVGGTALKRLMPSLELNDPGKVARFSVLGVGSCLIAATVGNLTLWAHGYISPAQLPQSFLTWWLGDAFGVQIFAPLTLVALAPSTVWKQRRTSVGLPLLLAFALSAVLYTFVRTSDERQLQRDFAAMVAPFEHEMRSLEENSGRALRQLAASYQLRGEVPGAELEHLVADIRSALPKLKTISWLPVLDAAEQEAYAKQVGSTAIHKAVYWPPEFKPSADGLVAPVAMIYPLKGSEMVLGMDMLGEPKRAAAVRAALARGQLTASTPIRLKSDPQGPGALLLMAPVQNTRVQGVLSGVIDLRTIDQALQAIPGVVWELRAVQDRAEEVLWRSSTVTMPDFSGNTHLDRLGVYSQQRLALGGKEWHLLLHLPHSKLVASAGTGATLVLMMALFVCALVAYFALIRTGERERITSEVQEKTAALNAEIAERKTYQAALEQSKRLAESANLAKSQFLATMSHEIRTPMNGILGMAQLLMMDDVGTEQRKEFVRTILGSGKALLAILNDILDLSKIEAGKMELSHGPFDAAALVGEVANLFREAAKAKGLTLVTNVQLPDRAPRYMGDSIRLRQMLANYVGNAIKFSDAGEILIALRERLPDGADSSGATLLEFAVSDQGVGIPQAKQVELFQPFVQADASATRRFGGTGLGLSIVRRLAEQMQGDVGVESQHGVGSRFWFTVNCPPAASGVEQRRGERRQVPPPGADGATRSGWVLVVDDNAINRMVAQNMLTRLGLAVRCVENGQEALDMLAAQTNDPPRLVLMDCQMPVMDGYAATRTIRVLEAAAGRPRQRIVALTADAFAADRELCLAAGMDDFLPKPMAFDDLVRIVDGQTE